MSQKALDENVMSPLMPGATAPAAASGSAASSSSLLPSSSTTSPPFSSAAPEAPESGGVEELVFDFGVYRGGVDPHTGRRNGYGELRYNSGNIYRGAWLDGAPHGYGEKIYTNGDIYRGEWRCGKRCGSGGYLYAAGHFFEGKYFDDQPHGYGVLHTVEGDCYTGQWRSGLKHGKGRETLRDGQVFTGTWCDGKKEGRGTLRLPGAAHPIRGFWREGHFVGTEVPPPLQGEKAPSANLAGAVDSTEGVVTVPQPREADAEGSALDSFGVSALSNAVAEKAWNGLDTLEMRLDALTRAMESAGIHSDGASGDDAVDDMLVGAGGKNEASGDGSNRNA
ncbi:phosphatidylinositol-4-phosphate 5-kinase [Trypanosoma grayi]|uniref:phosphatidylinositol-4-phosphate 5-kinase n=1 Tax=Trypanosoma grayi TaxID=71804 RepID=UPI0004F4B156|nr:phosphatidylinositol-4-phosphate 5-kinase [Trypanosoma grayi]KEG06735.1 phosphatidylinositol-4-phosphate 5-kinase [Trypanosoma grayi]